MGVNVVHTPNWLKAHYFLIDFHCVERRLFSFRELVGLEIYGKRLAQHFQNNKISSYQNIPVFEE